MFDDSPSSTMVGCVTDSCMSTNPILIGKAVCYADEGPTLASALATSSFDGGTAVGC
ncbi:hypothetical protein ACIPWF_10120 [Paenarthrobacter sp. NPDC089989]|uniref:hypothetical protein n=1 Tax=unclassified Paenarthrobacter TaxID=2634190 RepID=UPI003815D6DA